MGLASSRPKADWKKDVQVYYIEDVPAATGKDAAAGRAKPEPASDTVTVRLTEDGKALVPIEKLEQYQPPAVSPSQYAPVEPPTLDSVKAEMDGLRKVCLDGCETVDVLRFLWGRRAARLGQDGGIRYTRTLLRHVLYAAVARPGSWTLPACITASSANPILGIEEYLATADLKGYWDEQPSSRVYEPVKLPTPESYTREEALLHASLADECEVRDALEFLHPRRAMRFKGDREDYNRTAMWCCVVTALEDVGEGRDATLRQRIYALGWKVVKDTRSDGGSPSTSYSVSSSSSKRCSPNSSLGGSAADAEQHTSGEEEGGEHVRLQPTVRTQQAGGAGRARGQEGFSSVVFGGAAFQDCPPTPQQEDEAKQLKQPLLKNAL